MFDVSDEQVCGDVFYGNLAFFDFFSSPQKKIRSLSSIVEGTLDYNIVFDTLYVPDLVKKHYGITDAEMNANSLESLITTRIAVHDL